MQEIKDKIQELLKVDTTPNYADDTVEQPWDIQEKIFDELTALARSKNTLLGRILKFPMADGVAPYVITKVNKKTVQVKWIDYVDGYETYHLAKTDNVSMAEAKSTTHFEDLLDSMRNRKSSN